MKDLKVGDFLVLCREDSLPDGSPGNYVFATSKTFKEYREALRYLETISTSRNPIMVRVELMACPGELRAHIPNPFK